MSVSIDEDDANVDTRSWSKKPNLIENTARQQAIVYSIGPIPQARPAMQ